MRKQRARGGKRGIISTKYSVSKHLLDRLWRQWLGMCAIFHTVDTGYLKKEDSMVWRWAWDTKNPYAEAYGFQFGVADGARTHDNRNHNPGLYQLSYSHHKTFGAPDRNRTCNRPLRRRVLYPVELRALYLSCRSQFFGELWSGRWDSNSRPSAPKADALTRLRYAPIRKANSTHTAFALSSRQFEIKYRLD